MESPGEETGGPRLGTGNSGNDNPTVGEPEPVGDPPEQQGDKGPQREVVRQKQKRSRKKLVTYSERQTKDKEIDARIEKQTAKKRKWTGTEMVEFMARWNQDLKDLGLSIPPIESKEKKRLLPPSSSNIVSEGFTIGEGDPGGMENSSRGGFGAEPELKIPQELKQKGAGIKESKARINSEKVEGGVRAEQIMTGLKARLQKGEETKGDHSSTVLERDYRSKNQV